MQRSLIPLKERKKALYEKRKLRGLCVKCDNAPQPDRVCCAVCLEKYKTRSRQQETRQIKQEAIAAYGGQRCVCCGEAEMRFLCLDHINNDGAAHRRQLQNKSGHGGWSFYAKLKKAGFPKEPPLQVLCYNCNNGKRVNKGICPHQELKAVA